MSQASGMSDDPDRLYREAAAASARGEKAGARALLEKAAALAHPAALYTLGSFLLDGTAGARDLARALSCFDAAHRLGNSMAGHAALALEAAGIGLPAPDRAAAMDRLRRLAFGGDGAANRILAVLHALDGEGPAARTHAARALEAGDRPMSVLRGHFAQDAARTPWRDEPTSERVSEIGDVRRWPGFLPPLACDYLTLMAAPLLAPSRVFDPVLGVARPDPVRSSRTALFHPLDRDPVIRLIGERAAHALGRPETHGEPLSVLCYSPGEAYGAHLDAFSEDGGAGTRELARAGQRVATFLILLQDGFEGGETDFPHLSLRLRLRKGDALSFETTRADGSPDSRLLHAGLPVRSGRKWMASRWFRARPVPL